MTDATMAPASPERDWMTPEDFKAWFVRLGLSQAELGRRLEVKQATISRWLAGDRKIEHGEMLRLALERLSVVLQDERKTKKRQRRPAQRSGGEHGAGDGE